MSGCATRTCPNCLELHTRGRPLCGPCEYQRRKAREFRWSFERRERKKRRQRRQNLEYWHRTGKFNDRRSRSVKAYMRTLVWAAIRDGVLKRPRFCLLKSSRCSGRIEAHHSDYNKPLEVLWLCREHHLAWHRVFEATQINLEKV